MDSQTIILLSGPTASGKSKIALGIAHYLNGEIINADSMQIYKELSILTSRPSSNDQKKTKHYLYGFQSAKKLFSTGKWLKLVKRQVEKCIKKNKTPIIVGGTGLYFKAVTEGLTKIPNITITQRQNVRNLQKKIGQKKFYEKLVKLDPISENFVNNYDNQRSLRAFEVKRYTKKSFYEWIKITKSEFKDYKIQKLFIDTPRSVLLKNINKRVQKMFNLGAVDEVRNFLSLKVPISYPASKTIGIKEIEDYLNNKINKQQAIELINIRTRQYAKRQFTWARGHMKSWTRIYDKKLSILLRKIVKQIS